MDERGRESSRLRCQLDLLLADKKQHHITIEHLNKAIKDLKDESQGNVEVWMREALLYVVYIQALLYIESAQQLTAFD